MRPIFAMLLVLVLGLSGCTGGPSDTTVPDPPNPQVFEKGDNAKINQIIDGWQAQVPETMKSNAVKAESITQKVFTTTSSVQEVADFYQAQLPPKGWLRAARMPNVQGSILLTGYEAGNHDLVIGAFDAAQFGGSGTVVFIAQGTR